MSHESEIKNSVAQSKCVSDEALQLYVERKLSKEEIRVVELHLADCEICSDMVEGLNTVGNNAVFKKDVAEINARIQQKTMKKEGSIISISKGMRYAIAASIVLLLGTGFLFKYFLGESKKHEVAVLNEQEAQEAVVTNLDVESEKAAQTPTSPKGNISNQSEPNTQPRGANKADGALVTTVEKSNTVQNEMAGAGTSAETRKSTDANLSSGKAIFENDGISANSAERKEEMLEDESIQKPAEDDLKETTKAPSTKSNASIPVQAQVATEEYSTMSKKGSISTESVKRETVISLDEAKVDFMKADYIGAKKKLKAIKAQQPQNEEAIFMLAKTERALKEYSGSNKLFDEIISNKNSVFKEESEWQKALNLVDAKKKSEALQLLKKIGSAKGKYAYAASEMIGELE